MDQQQMQMVKERLSVLEGQQLRYVFRSMDMVCFEFGNIVTKKVFGRDENGKPTWVEESAGEYALHLQCSFRIVRDDHIVLAKNDMFQPSTDYLGSHSLDESNDIPDDFDYDQRGANRMDEILSTTFLELNGFFIASIQMMKTGDLNLVFRNGFQLNVFVDVSGDVECWRFFRANHDDTHLVVTAEGLMIDDGSI
ncbi:MAG: hypothetical protein RR653_09725 [Clostridia bacterium]